MISHEPCLSEIVANICLTSKLNNKSLTCRKRNKRDAKSVCNSPVDNDHVLTDLSGDNNGFQGYDCVTSGSVAKAQSAASPSTPGHIVTSGGDEYAIVDKGNDDTSLVDNVEYVSGIRSRDSQDDTSLVENSQYDTFH